MFKRCEEDRFAVWVVCSPKGSPVAYLVGRFSEVLPAARLIEGHFSGGHYGPLIPLTVPQAIAMRRNAGIGPLFQTTSASTGSTTARD